MELLRKNRPQGLKRVLGTEKTQAATASEAQEESAKKGRGHTGTVGRPGGHGNRTGTVGRYGGRGNRNGRRCQGFRHQAHSRH
eukprot:514100-Amphidinium_carterae.1